MKYRVIIAIVLSISIMCTGCAKESKKETVESTTKTDDEIIKECKQVIIKLFSLREDGEEITQSYELPSDGYDGLADPLVDLVESSNCFTDDYITNLNRNIKTFLGRPVVSVKTFYIDGVEDNKTVFYNRYEIQKVYMYQDTDAADKVCRMTLISEDGINPILGKFIVEFKEQNGEWKIDNAYD